MQPTKDGIDNVEDAGGIGLHHHGMRWTHMIACSSFWLDGCDHPDWGVYGFDIVSEQPPGTATHSIF
jgi:hypothetical protein